MNKTITQSPHKAPTKPTQSPPMESRSFINVFCTLDDNRRKSLLETLNKESTESRTNIANVIKTMNMENLNMILDISPTGPVAQDTAVPEPVVSENPMQGVPGEMSRSQRVYHMMRERKEKEVADWIESNFDFNSRISSMRLVDIHQLYLEQGGVASNKLISRVLSERFNLIKTVISCKTKFFGIRPVSQDYDDDDSYSCDSDASPIPPICFG